MSRIGVFRRLSDVPCDDGEDPRQKNIAIGRELAETHRGAGRHGDRSVRRGTCSAGKVEQRQCDRPPGSRRATPSTCARAGILRKPSVLVPAYGVHEDLLEVEVDGANALGCSAKMRWAMSSLSSRVATRNVAPTCSARRMRGSAARSPISGIRTGENGFSDDLLAGFSSRRCPLLTISLPRLHDRNRVRRPRST